MKLKVNLYLSIVFVMIICVFLANLFNYNTENVIVITMIFVFLSFFAVRQLFPPESKYRFLFIITLFILFLSNVTSSGINLGNYNNGARYQLIIIGFLGYIITLYTIKIIIKKLEVKGRILVFMLFDILAIPIFTLLFIVSHIHPN